MISYRQALEATSFSRWAMARMTRLSGEVERMTNLPEMAITTRCRLDLAAINLSKPARELGTR